jgi:hypothetical protein
LSHESFYHIEKTQEQVNDFYKKQFVTIKDVITVDSSDLQPPAELSKFIKAEDLKEIANEKLLWIRIEFPNVINNDMLQNYFVPIIVSR